LIFVRRKEKNKLVLSCATVSKFPSDPKLHTPYIVPNILAFLTFLHFVKKKTSLG
jgi:hypothetical protein